MDDVSVRDLVMMYKSSVVMWKGTPVFVKSIGEDYRFTVFDLGKQTLRVLKWNPDNFTSPSVRIGYVNLGTNCVYAHRRPVRKYKVGLSVENVVQIDQEHRLSPYEAAEAKEAIGNLKSLALYNALMNNYPSLEEAYEEAKEVKGIVAFDKQFAIHWEGNVYYKGRLVGTYYRGSLVFNAGFEHLNRALLSK